ncbi:hypothetical protein SprV_0100315100 [Sparganum proliferum]
MSRKGSRFRDLFRRIFRRNEQSRSYRSVGDLTLDPNADFQNTGRNFETVETTEPGLLHAHTDAYQHSSSSSESPRGKTKRRSSNGQNLPDPIEDGVAKFKRTVCASSTYTNSHSSEDDQRGPPIPPARSARRKETKGPKPPTAPARSIPHKKSEPKVQGSSPTSSSSLSAVTEQDSRMRMDVMPVMATKESKKHSAAPGADSKSTRRSHADDKVKHVDNKSDGAKSTSNATAKPDSLKPRNPTGLAGSNFQDELAAKLSAGPMFGGRPPILGARASNPPVSPKSGAGASGDSVRLRHQSAEGEASQENASEQPEDAYMAVAMQRVALSRQRKHRMPTRYSSNLNTSDLSPDSSSAATGGGGLNQITEEEDDGEADDRLRRHSCQSNRHGSNGNSRHSSSGVPMDSSSSSDLDDSPFGGKPFGRISKSSPLEDREPASPFSVASSSSPCGQSFSYADRSEEDEEGGGGGGGGGGTVSRSPLTSSSGDGLFDASEPIVTPRTRLRPSGGRPSSMFVGGSLQEELQGIVQARLSRILTTTSRTGEGDQSVKLGPVLRPKEPQIRRRRSPPRANNTQDQGQGFGVVLRRTAPTTSGAASTLETRRSSGSTSTSSSRRAVSMALTGLEDRPPRVHDLIKAFQRDSR